jgi:biopolymer transport protein ExbD
MAFVKQSSLGKGITEANITPLADVTTTLIVIFLITMPVIMWSGINVNSAEPGSDQQVISPKVKSAKDIITVTVEPDGIQVNGEAVILSELEAALRIRLATMADKTVVVVPSDLVELGLVVSVLDAAKAGGGQQLALLNEVRNDARGQGN